MEMNTMFARSKSYFTEPIGQGTRLGQELCVLLSPHFVQEMENIFSFPFDFFFFPKLDGFGENLGVFLGG